MQLTIDAALQARTEQVLAEIGERYHPTGATAIVMDPQTCDVLAMANWPALDPTDLGEADEDELLQPRHRLHLRAGLDLQGLHRRRRARGGPGHARGRRSTSPPTIQVADRMIEEAHAARRRHPHVADILAQSSNVGAVTIGLELGADRFDDWVRSFGFGKPTGIGIPGEEAGIVLDPDDYSGSSMGNLPIGQGLSVTPLQMAAGYAAIANGGILQPPRLIVREGGERDPDAERRAA